MAARKLQTEIDKTLKKVAEGVEIFEDMYELLQRSTNSTQKEKMESDLKTQIKKLQRLRDQIKTWLQSNDIKDKKPLLDNRKLIETQMEKFKAIEKEMKTKAFSKEGLIAAAKMNPKDREKAEITDWLSTQVDELSRQVESAEAEIETISGSGKKKKGSAKDERASLLENANDRRNWHISRLEILLRMLENGNLDTDRVTDIKEDISYFVESNMEEDFEEDEGIYDDLNLDDGEEAFGLKETDDMHSNVDSTAGMDDLSFRDTPSKPRRDSVVADMNSSSTANSTTTIGSSNPAAVKEETAASPVSPTPAQPAASPVAPASASKKTTKKASQEPVAVPKEKAVPTANFAQAKAPPASQSAVLSPPKAPSAAPLPPIRYAAAAAAAVASSAAVAAADNSAASPSTTTGSIATDSATDSVPASAAAAPGLQSQPVSAAAQPVGAPLTPAKSSVDALKNDAADKARSASPAPPGLTKVDTDAAQAQEGSTSGFQPAQLAASSAAASVVQPAGGGAGTAAQQAAAQREAGTEARLPTSLTDLVSSFESAKQKSLRREANVGLVHKSLESSFINVPEALDSEKPKYYVAKNPFPTPSYYPQTPASVFDNPALYAKFDVDTLFYIFYYQQGTYHQYLAAKELKKQSWRFHKQYLTWFQRHSEPQAITDEYEQGVYVYFDWEGSWCQRKKSDFRFEYRWLEDN
ncbi:related to NOT3-general negative regulator of transcription, subunit 3 [Sporisorium reilianum SRZ2]|uniref:General negative regulator of transcription subunit n=1 Tax=Sporisorium reilianum (strain SRZ2) TaxID=999809 RepID=E6ZWH2_SPORE|nr:related to NOT3-general negative regulator of transcription, subunit 3 [Sporisorium reilianum SRZ2]